MRQSVLRGYAAGAIGGLEYSPRRGGMRGKYGAVSMQSRGLPQPGRSVLRQPKLARQGGPWPLQIEMEYSPPLLLVILARGGGRSKGGGFSAAF